MKKVLCTLVTALLLTAMLATAISAAPSVLWDFGDDPEMESKFGSSSDLEWAMEDFYAIFTTTAGSNNPSNDPNIYVNTPSDSVDNVIWVKVRVRNPSPATAIEIYAATNGRSLAGPECTHIDIDANSDEWKTYVVYIPDANVQTSKDWKLEQYWLDSFYWEGSVDQFRLDPMWREGALASGDHPGNMEAGSQIMIDYVAFFASEEEANAFMSANEQAAAEAAAPAEEPTEEATEAPTVEAPTTAPTTESAPQTADMASFAIAAAALSLVTAAIVAKKRK